MTVEHAPFDADPTPGDIEAEVAAGRWTPRPIEDADYDRRRFIGGSNAAALMGLAPEYDGQRDTPLTVWRAKTSDVREELDPEKQLFLTRRKRWEPVVVEMLREEMDAEILAVNRRYVDPHLPFVASELDFEWRDPSDGSAQNGEIKTVSPFAFKEKFGWGEPGTDQVPINYFAQCMHGMMVTGRRACVLAAMVGIDRMVFYRIERNAETIADMRRAYVKFWTENVLRGVAPDAMSMGDLKILFPSSKSMSVEASSAVGSKALKLRALRSQIDAIEMEMIALEFDVRLEMKDAEKLLVDGRPVFSWKEQGWSRLDVTSLKASKDKTEKAVYLKYLKQGTQRVFKPLYG